MNDPTFYAPLPKCFEPGQFVDVQCGILVDLRSEGLGLSMCGMTVHGPDGVSGASAHIMLSDVV